MKHKDVNGGCMVGYANAPLGNVLAVVESDNGRKCAGQEVETPYRDLEIKAYVTHPYQSVLLDYRGSSRLSNFDLFVQMVQSGLI